MNLCWSIIGGLTLVGLAAQAQVSVELILEQDQFLVDESLPVKVRVTNLSGQTIQLGGEAGWLLFQVETRQGRIISQSGDFPLVQPFAVESSQSATREVDLMPHYDLKPGRYLVRATVRIRQWEQQVSSGPESFEIIKGTKLWEEVVGIPAEGGPPEARKYTLQQANYLSRLYLYVRITDVPESQVFRVLPLGRLVSFSRPEAQIDRQSNLHVLFQTGPRDFRYCVISPLGRMTRRERHDYTDTRPVLRRAAEGGIGVAGGIRRVTRYDLPAPVVEEDSELTDDTLLPSP